MKRTTCTTTRSPAYDPLSSLIGGTADLTVVENHWDDVLRVAASVGAGLVPPSVILKKIAASPRQNGLDPTVMLVAKSGFAFCSHASRLTKPAFAPSLAAPAVGESALAAGPMTSPPASTVVSPAATWMV